MSAPKSKRPRRRTASPDFKKDTVQKIAMRSAYRCSNPDCDKLTLGPNQRPDKTTLIGEAAHIFGAKGTAKRYREQMTDAERSTISNAIWLCTDCHTLIDRDDLRFPADLLLLWKLRHEERITNEIGKPGDLIRAEWMKQQSQEFLDLPSYARQIIADRPDHWEYKLTAELLDHFLTAPLRNWSDLKRGLYTKKVFQPDPPNFLRWVRSQTEELVGIITALSNVVSECFGPAWGEPGVPGSPTEIAHACRLVAQSAKRLVEWEEEIRFTHAPEGFGGLLAELAPASSHALGKLPEISKFIRSIFGDGEPVSGTYSYVLVIDLPEGWNERVDAELVAGYDALAARGFDWG